MDKCPKCNKHTVEYDSYRDVNRCLVDGCTAIIINKEENTYSYLKHDYSRGLAERIKVVEGVETEVLKIFKLN